MVSGPADGDDADMLAVRPHRTYHLRLRIVTGLVASTLVVLLASLPSL